MNTVGVTFRRDREDAVWLVHVTDDERLHTYGRTINRARQAIREVIALWRDIDEDAIELDESYDLGPHIDAALDARDAAAEAERRALATTADAARRLRAQGISYRDAAEILGLSYQRVHQLAR